MCWVLGARTNWSCKNHGEAMAVEPGSPAHLQALRQSYLGYAVVDFRTPEDLTLFLTGAARGGPGTPCICGWSTTGPGRLADPGERVGPRHQCRRGGAAAGRRRLRPGTGRVYRSSRDIAETTDRLHRYLSGHERAPTSIDWDHIGW